MTTFDRVQAIVWLLKQGYTPDQIRQAQRYSARDIEIAVDTARFC